MFAIANTLFQPHRDVQEIICSVQVLVNAIPAAKEPIGIILLSVSHTGKMKKKKKTLQEKLGL